MLEFVAAVTQAPATRTRTAGPHGLPFHCRLRRQRYYYGYPPLPFPHPPPLPACPGPCRPLSFAHNNNSKRCMLLDGGRTEYFLSFLV